MGQRDSQAGVSVDIDFDSAVDEIKHGIMDEIAEGADIIAGKSKAQVPVETGALRDNCTVVIDADSAEVVYDLPYAIEQHEDMNKKHSRGKAKYLEEPFNEESGRIIERAVQKIARTIE